MPKKRPKNQPDPTLNPNGKEDFENLLRTALFSKPIKPFAKNKKGLVSMASYARSKRMSRQRVEQLVKAGDKRIFTVLVDDKVYIDPEASTWVPEKDKPVEAISHIKEVRVRKERPLGKTFILAADYAKKWGVKEDLVLSLIVKKHPELKWRKKGRKYYVSTFSKWRPWSA